MRRRIASYAALLLLMLLALAGCAGAEPGGEQMPGVPAAPNRSAITAQVISMNQSAEFADRWHFELLLSEIRPLQGGTFARSGDTIRGFTIATLCDLQPGDTISAEAEFVGAASGQFRLSSIAAVGRQAGCR